MACRSCGVEVVTVAPSRTPLSHVLGETIGRVLESLHRDHGVTMNFEDAVAAFEGDGLHLPILPWIARSARIWDEPVQSATQGGPRCGQPF